MSHETIIDISADNATTLHSTNITVLVNSLQKHKDTVGFSDKISTLSLEAQQQLRSTRFWNPLADKMRDSIHQCVTDEEKLMRNRKKELFQAELCSIKAFATANASSFSTGCFNECKCAALLIVLGGAFVSMLKHDMCQGFSNGIASVSNTVDAAFSMNSAALEITVAHSVDNSKQLDVMRESLYYIAGWHAFALKKASKRRRLALRTLMENIFTITQTRNL